jgi:hypothetical protein
LSRAGRIRALFVSPVARFLLLQSVPNEDNKYAEDRTHPKAY